MIVSSLDPPSLFSREDQQGEEEDQDQPWIDDRTRNTVRLVRSIHSTSASLIQLFLAHFQRPNSSTLNHVSFYLIISTVAILMGSVAVHPRAKRRTINSFVTYYVRRLKTFTRKRYQRRFLSTIVRAHESVTRRSKVNSPRRYMQLHVSAWGRDCEAYSVQALAI